MHLYCAPILFKMICHVLGNKIGSHLIFHAFMSSTCRFFCRSVRCIFCASSVRCFFGNRTLSWCEQRQVLLPLPDCRQVILPCYLCLFSVSYSTYLLFLASLMSRCLCLDPICMFTWQPWYSHTPTSYYMLLVYLVSLASRSACLAALLESCCLFVWSC